MNQHEQSGSTQQTARQTPSPPVMVDVFAKQENGKIRFTHDWRFEGGPSKGNAPIEVPEGSRDTEIRFFLRDADLGLQFLGTPEEAMWVEKVPDPDPGNKCPPGPGDGGQIDFRQSQSQPKLLKVLDVNSEQCDLRYGLRFQGPNGIEIYDPIIKNGGG